MNKLMLLVFPVLLTSHVFATSETLKKTDVKSLNDAAYVESVQYLKGPNAGVKLFVMTGGDPAMNGAHVNLAVFADRDLGWNVFELANVRSYEVVPSSKKGYLKLKLVRDTLDDDGNVVDERSVLFVNILNAENGSIEVEEVR